MKKLSWIISDAIKYIVLIAMIILIVWGFALTNLMIRPRINDLIETVASSKANEINYFLDNRIRELTKISGFYDYGSTIETNMATLVACNKLFDYYTSMGIVDSEGVVHTTSNVSFPIVEREYYQQAQEETLKPVISNNIYSLEDNEPIIIILIPMEQELYLSAAINVSHIIDVVSDNNIFSSSIRIVDKDNKTAVQVNPFSDELLIYKADIERHPLWTLEVGIHPFYINSIFYILGCVFVVTFAGMYFYLSSQIKTQVAKELSPLENMAESMKNNDWSGGEYLAVKTKSAEVYSILTSYNELLHRTYTLIRNIEVEQKKRRDSEYQALLEQVKPHFLYNTLETIQVMALDYDDDRVSDSIGLLAKYFRLSLADSKKHVTLQHEVDLVQSYMRLQKLRYGDLIDLTVQTNLDLRKYTVIKFMLQPLVENAIYHGAKKNNCPTEIVLQILTEQDKLVIRIKNAARDLDQTKLGELRQCLKQNKKPDGCTGIFNVYQRLVLDYSDPFMDIWYAENTVVVEIRLSLGEVQ